ncbi:MAG: trypsin-like peptidase domain-containing protein [Eubacteriales bacterium]|nr:trypsin-like peptidase domain-containing protein [Eubacteriales bacterium]
MEDRNEKNEKREQMKKLLKKGASATLCAALAGSLAIGAYQGIGYLSGWGGASNVQAAISRNEKDVALLKSEKSKESDDTEGTTTRGSLDVSDIVEEAMPSVVVISTKAVEEVQNYFGMFSQYGYAPEEREIEGSGSGIIIGRNDEELLIATNYHVVEGADTLSVGFIDNNAYEAKVKGYDGSKDLAVVSVPLEDIDDDTLDEISIATIGSSDDLRVGEQVIAIGNALGYGQSVTTGIVSAKTRRTSSDYSTTVDEDSSGGINLIQTDAAINPGNSGGALLNMDGEVVGINSAKLASTEIEGIGYAIAISDVSDILEVLMNEEARERIEDGNHGVLGIKGSTVSQEAIQIYGIPEGVFVAEITKGGAAEDAGLEENCVITKFQGRTVTTINQLIDILEYYEPGEEVTLTVQIPDGKEYREEEITLELGENEDAKKGDKKQKKEDEATEEDEDDQERGGIDFYKDWENGFGDGWQ